MDGRTITINDGHKSGKSVVYVMSRDQRVKDNHALLMAQAKALETKQPLVVVFNLLNNVPNRSREHLAFMLSGLEEVARDLKSLHINFIMCSENANLSLKTCLASLRASTVYFDFSPLNGPQTRIKKIAHDLGLTCFVVDTHNIIPVWAVSDKQEFASRTFRPKVHKLLADYMVEPAKVVAHPYKAVFRLKSITFETAYRLIEAYPKRGIKLVLESGEAAANRHLSRFIETKLANYATGRNDISSDQQSGLSPYLHFGQISSLRVALEVMHAAKEIPFLFERAKIASPSAEPSMADGMNALFEEIIVRKELSDNFCFYNPHYASLLGAPSWALKSLEEHASDKREYTYAYAELERAETHDDAWNAAQTELTKTGKIHGYMRMYWAKKILEWTVSAEQALDFGIRLNDSYSIDGCDPNGYVGILWSVAGLHDRPWTERPVFGKIRYMNYAGLKRKFNLNKYIKGINDL